MYRRSCNIVIPIQCGCYRPIKLKVSVLDQHSSPRIRQWHPACSNLGTVQNLYINIVQSVYINVIIRTLRGW
jgi:hypothetical protein